jgi:hypothetical protein
MQAVQQQETTTPQTTGRMMRVDFDIKLKEKTLSGSYFAKFDSTIDAIVDALDSIPKVCRIRVRPLTKLQPFEVTGWAA